ncbi:MAG: Ada metal-binding domain-containing protein [Aristaeellaceae bacterium]
MKKKLTLLWTLLLLALPLFAGTTAAAEMVSQRSYTLVTAEYTRSGLYSGEMKNGKPEGFGVFCAVNDDGVAWHYVGYWAGGLMNGQGGSYWDNGSVEIGEYRNGLFVQGDVRDGTGRTVTGPAGSPTNTETYIGNKGTGKFHDPSCSSVNDIKESNKVMLNSREEAISKGYKPCGRCKP